MFDVERAKTTPENAILVHAVLEMQQRQRFLLKRAGNVMFEMLVFGYQVGLDLDENQMEAVADMHDDFCNTCSTANQLGVEIQMAYERLCPARITE